MMSSWCLVWMVFMFVLIAAPMGYGWGYRGWGPPYPTYIQRRREQQAAATRGSAGHNHRSWGWGGEFVWMALFIGMFWAISSVWWWRR